MRRVSPRCLGYVVAAIASGTLALGSGPRAPSASGQTGGAPAAKGSAAPIGAPAAGRAERTDIRHTVLVNGELRAASSREISVPNIKSGFASTVTFLAPEGAHVKTGDRILEYDGSALLSQESEAKRKLDEARLKIDKTRADQESTRCDLLAETAQAEGNLKVAELYGAIGRELLPANTYQKYQLDLEKARLALGKAREKLANHVASIPAQMALVELDRAQADLDLKKIQGDLKLLSVDAPQDGIVIYGDNWASNRKVQIGDTLFPSMPVLTLPDLASLRVIGFVYDTELRLLQTGMACDLSIDAMPGRRWPGKIAALTAVASRKGFASQHKVFRATVQPDAVDLAVMKPGMTVRVEIPVVLASQVVAIPREFVGVDAEGRYFVRKDQVAPGAAPERVKIGVFNDRLVQIVEGLAPGERVLRPDAVPRERQ